MMNIGDCNWRFSSGQSKADSFPREGSSQDTVEAEWYRHAWWSTADLFLEQG